MRKIERFAVALLAVGMIGAVSQSIGQPATAQAAAKVKVVWNKKTGQQTLKVKSSAKGYVYTSRLKHKVLKLSNYKKTTFYSTRSAKLKVNGSNRLYYYVTNSSNKKAGWVWNGYLTRQSSSSSSAASSKKPTLISMSTLQTLIDTGTDLDPSAQILNQPSAFYKTYESVLKKNFNMNGQISNFTNHWAKIYVAKSNLTSYVQDAMATWNKALGRTVFTLGSATDHNITLTTKASSQWDGLNQGDTIYVNSKGLSDPNYTNTVADTPEIRTLYAQYTAAVANYKAASSMSDRESYRLEANALADKMSAAQIAAAPTARQYWENVITHELGHSLGIDHTPYLIDVMYADASSDGFSDAVDAKYAWKTPKDPGSTRNETGQLSPRDIDRAKLGFKLGYW
ncbi:M57 family metalloprotease [Secundilactobacillus kimchicus]|uniref:M57 family metalloprotease n=1 Tax=Secundilactobacillus kimchicus TaxID=528209 RepID=UPI0024A9494B|nr:hypothetical protein [Secundilactobacillus kimchicus]